MEILSSHQHPIQMRGSGGLRVVVREENGRGAVSILDGQKKTLMALTVRVLSPEDLLEGDETDGSLPILLRYPGKATHPAGDGAPVSWFNEHGQGLVRVIDGRRLIILPLLGLLLSPHVPLSATKGSRGPSRASDLWLTVAAWCTPGSVSLSWLRELTGMSTPTVAKWRNRMEELGLVAEAPGPSNAPDGRWYAITAAGRPVLANLMQDRWREWRSATGHQDLRPRYYRFVAKEPWKVVYRQVQTKRITCFPSGITVLEGGPGAGSRSWLMPSNQWPEVFLYTTVKDSPFLLEALGVTAVDQADEGGPPLSTLCVLPDDHPAIRLVSFRSSDAKAMGLAWPWGLAALDAIDHPDARVRQAAREAWREWVDDPTPTNRAGWSWSNR